MGGRRNKKGCENRNHKKKHHKKDQSIKNQKRSKSLNNEDELDDFHSLDKALFKYNLSIYRINSDGNCLFRAFSHQHCNDEELHELYRIKAIKYMENHSDQFISYIDDKEDFETYCTNMLNNGTWGGHLELHSLSKAFNVNIVIYQLGQNPLIIANFPPFYRCIQLSYHNNEHFNSVIPINSTKPSTINNLVKLGILNKNALQYINTCNIVVKSIESNPECNSDGDYSCNSSQSLSNKFKSLEIG
ncbi:OTU-like cysteine protease family protein [Cryptosporidium muris RN66]|uniref:OTU-like cysteine protease family protein n=1 Tax=Cryptosporidium muris (strain RN66) TaxID=441375 RepID=B6AEW7_CRYMR|nr:OTU-like cysteine protease family protein [Cryptosporidium muris RN66]EEA06734.1 OTU-like cysteine protease family protein [Cryptosporidium muris RN66]|eukprot:XP_002141083.1 OTU-like cysteine protease family protein [Cryptosporidium muris RN66]